MKRFLSAFAGALAMVISTPSMAAVDMYLYEEGGSVVVESEGLLDLSGLRFVFSVFVDPGVNPSVAYIASGASGSIDLYNLPEALASFGSGSYTPFPMRSGNYFGIGGSGTLLAVRAGADPSVLYDAAGMASLAGATFASLGITATGSQTLTLNNGDTITVNYGTSPAAVPLPGALPLMLAGLGGLALKRRRS